MTGSAHRILETMKEPVGLMAFGTPVEELSSSELRKMLGFMVEQERSNHSEAERAIKRLYEFANEPRPKRPRNVWQRVFGAK